MLEVGVALFWKGQIPRVIRPKKECIKSYETCFANILNLNDKGLSMQCICSPKFYSPLANWPWPRISPHSSLNVIYCLIITAWQWLMSLICILMQIKPNKSPLRHRLLAFLLWEIGHLSSPSRSCLGRLILIHSGQGGPVGKASTQRKREKYQCMVASHVHPTGYLPAAQVWFVHWLGIKPVTFWFTGSHSIHWATPTRWNAIF